MSNFMGAALTLDDIYPVGSIYMSANKTSPAALFGGTWEQLKDRFLLGAGGSYTLGNTGGEASHTLTVAEMPSHTHDMQGYWTVKDRSGSSEAASYNRISSDPATSNTPVLSAGGGSAHNNMPPFEAVNIWKRVS